MKKKILSLCLVVALIALLTVGGTLAYFTDRDEVTNVFTAGSVDIDLTEQSPYDASQRVDVGSDDVAQVNYGDLFPGMVVTKDPTIANIGSLEAYVAAKVELNKSIAQDLLSGGLLDLADGYEMDVYVHPDGSATIYFFITAPVQPGEEVVLFETLTVPTTWDNPEMAAINGLKIRVEAFATQVYGFANCREAMAAAFAGEF